MKKKRNIKNVVDSNYESIKKQPLEEKVQIEDKKYFANAPSSKEILEYGKAIHEFYDPGPKDTTRNEIAEELIEKTSYMLPASDRLYMENNFKESSNLPISPVDAFKYGAIPSPIEHEQPATIKINNRFKQFEMFPIDRLWKVNIDPSRLSPQESVLYNMMPDKQITLGEYKRQMNYPKINLLIDEDNIELKDEAIDEDWLLDSDEEIYEEYQSRKKRPIEDEEEEAVINICELADKLTVLQLEKEIENFSMETHVDQYKEVYETNFKLINSFKRTQND